VNRVFLSNKEADLCVPVKPNARNRKSWRPNRRSARRSRSRNATAMFPNTLVPLLKSNEISWAW